MVSERRERAQVILIGAVALAFIILGIVVVFNGVLYTETLSSGGTSQTASDANVVELEVEQSIGCLLYRVDDADGNESHVKTNITEFSGSYRNITAGSTATAVNVTDVSASENSSGYLQANVTIRYNSTDLSYKRTQNITQSSCPTEGVP